MGDFESKCTSEAEPRGAYFLNQYKQPKGGDYNMSILGPSKAWIIFFGHGPIKDAYYKWGKKKKKTLMVPTIDVHHIQYLDKFDNTLSTI